MKKKPTEKIRLRIFLFIYSINDYPFLDFIVKIKHTQTMFLRSFYFVVVYFNGSANSNTKYAIIEHTCYNQSTFELSATETIFSAVKTLQ